MTKTKRRRGYTYRPRSCSESSLSTAYGDSSNPSSCQSEASSNSSVNDSVQESRSYKRIRNGLRRSIPAAIVMWAFHRLPSENGLTSRRVINFLKKHYRVIDNPRKTGKSIGSLLRCAVEFGLIQKRGNRYFLVRKSSHHRG